MTEDSITGRPSWTRVGTTAFGLSFMYASSNWSPRRVIRCSWYSSPFSASTTRTFCAQTELTLWYSSSTRDVLRREGQPAHAHAERVVQRIGDRRDGGAHGAFPRSQGRIRVLHDRDFDRRRIAEPQDRILLPANSPRLPFFLQRPARRLHAAALDLVDDAVGVDRQAGVHCGNEPGHLQFRTRGLDLRDDRAVRADVLVARVGDASPSSLRLLPRSRFPHRLFEHCPSARILQVLKAKPDRIPVRQLVHERFDGEHVAERTERAQR